MQIAVYGGSFNPPHVAHAMVAAWLLWTRRAEQVWLVPVFRHAFEGRHGKTLAPFDQRVAWCRALAADVDSRVRVQPIEAELPTPSYTIDTLRALASRHPQHRLRLVIGADVVPQLPQWRSWPEIAASFEPVVVGRGGHSAPDGRETVDFPEVSSTDIRRRIAAGLRVDHLLTARVAELMNQSSAPTRSWT